ncbi:hypothetical protein FB446DRAFT_739595 [Lentinula raphanica]|nr:hypothetical protein FB446DRAFT_739595 [Lentinula raphanica]
MGVLHRRLDNNVRRVERYPINTRWPGDAGEVDQDSVSDPSRGFGWRQGFCPGYECAPIYLFASAASFWCRKVVDDTIDRGEDIHFETCRVQTVLRYAIPREVLQMNVFHHRFPSNTRSFETKSAENPVPIMIDPTGYSMEAKPRDVASESFIRR